MSLKEVLLDELRDLYSAENQLVKALPKSVKTISDAKMKEGVAMHLEQTKAQVQRLREIFEKLDEKPTGKHCNGMEGCIAEVTEALEEDTEGALKDAGIVGAALRVEHYEIAGYTAAIAMAKVLGEKEVVGLLTESLHEEEAAAKQILSAAPAVLKAADAQEDEDDDEDEEDEEKDPEEKESEEKSEEDENEAAPDVDDAPKPAAKKSAAKKSAAKK